MTKRNINLQSNDLFDGHDPMVHFSICLLGVFKLRRRTLGLVEERRHGVSVMRRAGKAAIDTGFGKTPDLLRTPLLQQQSDEEAEAEIQQAQSGDEYDSDKERSDSESPNRRRGGSGDSVDDSARQDFFPDVLPKRSALREAGDGRNNSNSLTPSSRGGRGSRGRGAGVEQRRVSLEDRRSAGSSRASSLEPVGEDETQTLPQPHNAQDYRSEGEQPSTSRNGARRRSDLDFDYYDITRRAARRGVTKQDSFRAARMPKRGGRKRLRRVRSVRRKIRVSSYCVARELQTLQLLRWLESQPNRRLSQRLRAEGGTVPHGPMGSGRSKATRRSMLSVAEGSAAVAVAATVAEGGVIPTVARGAVGAIGGRGAAPRSEAGARGAGSVAPAGPSPQVEWMDSLYIDVIHSTTDLRGGLRKARELARPAAVEAADNGNEYFDGYYGEERDDDSRDSRREGGVDGGLGEGSRTGREDDEDDDELTHKDVIFFPYGAVVFWGCSEAEEKEMLSGLKRFIVGKVSDTELAESFDDMTFVYRQRGSGKSVPLKNDEITLDTRDPAEKLAYSCALAQSAKLFVFEERLDGTIESTAKYPQMLAATGKIPLSEVQIGKLVGKVLCEQNEVNLHSDILDTPEYFWEDDVWEPAYQALCSYLDIPLRVDNLNKRLDILRELLDVLSTQSTNAHATRLEVIIIYLIFVEVAIELVWNVVIKDIFNLIGCDSY